MFKHLSLLSKRFGTFPLQSNIAWTFIMCQSYCSLIFPYTCTNLHQFQEIQMWLKNGGTFITSQSCYCGPIFPAGYKLDYIWEINDCDSANFWLKRANFRPDGPKYQMQCTMQRYFITILDPFWVHGCGHIANIFEEILKLSENLIFRLVDWLT